MTQQEIDALIRKGRDFIRPPEDDDADYQTDQEKRLPQPPLVTAPGPYKRFSLPADYAGLSMEHDFLKVINSRSSRRIYTDQPLSLLRLSLLLWCTQGIKGIRGKKYATLRTVPCGGARHEFECYLLIRRVEGLPAGCYHYLPMTHELELIRKIDDPDAFAAASLCGQRWAAKASVVFYYAADCYRAEWRYGIHAHRVMLIDAGHITENLYLTATALGLGSCAIGAVEGRMADEAFGLDGENLFVFYAHTVGTVDPDMLKHEDDIYAFVREQGL